MLIHVTPQFFTCARSGPYVELVDLRVDQLGLFLRGGKELTTRRPFPNKHFAVACRKTGRKAIGGILIETPKPLAEFTVETRWAIEAETLVKHRVKYVVLDQDFDTVTDQMSFWFATLGIPTGDFTSRWPEAHKGAVPVKAQPRMQLAPDAHRTGIIEDRLFDGRIEERSETFPVPTIERARLYSRNTEMRIPSIDMAFRIG